MLREVNNSSVPVWSVPPEVLELAGDEVHIWRATLDQPPERLHGLQQFLTADEQARADRFYFDKHRRHFIVARGLLRVILSRYLNVGPNQLRFEYTSYGKPFLTTEFGGQRLRFNLSHSHLLALYAIAGSREIGVDIEYIRLDIATQEIAERFFSSREVAALRSLPPERRIEAFFNCWTRKEAYIKARGEGLSLPLNQFDVSLAPDEPAALLKTRPDPQEAARWTLQELDPGPNYVAALAVEGRLGQLRCWRLTER